MSLLVWLLEYILHLYKLKPPSKINNLKVQQNMAIANLTWTLPTTRTDGTPLAVSEIASVTVTDAQGASTGISGAQTSFTTGTLNVGDHSFSVTVTDTTGHTSAPSNVVTVTVPATLASPSAITDLAVVLT